MTIVSVGLRCIFLSLPLMIGLAPQPAPGQDGGNTSQFDDKSALQVLELMRDAGVAGEMIETFLANGGMFDLEQASGENAIYAHGTAIEDPEIKIPAEYFGDDGKLTGEANIFLINDLVHEFFHAYVDQVVEQGHDPETERILERGLAWLNGQKVEGSDRRIVSSVVYFLDAADGDTEVARELQKDFLEEYIGQIINRLAFQRQRIAKKLAEGRIGRAEAAALWAEVVAGATSASFQGYYDSDLPNATVMESPPAFLVDHLAGVMGLAYEGDCDSGIVGVSGDVVGEWVGKWILTSTHTTGKHSGKSDTNALIVESTGGCARITFAGAEGRIGSLTQSALAYTIQAGGNEVQTTLQRSGDSLAGQFSGHSLSDDELIGGTYAGKRGG